MPTSTIDNVRVRLDQYQAISAYVIQQRYRIQMVAAIRIIQSLQEEERVSKCWDQTLGGYPILSKGRKIQP